MQCIIIAVIVAMIAGCDRKKVESARLIAPIPAGEDHQEVVRRLNSFAPVLMARLQKQCEKPEAKQEFTLLGTDVKKTDSVITPIVGVVRIQRFWSAKDGTGYFTQVLTFDISQSGTGWKCLKVECRQESDSSDPTRIGKVDERTDGFREIVERQP